MSPVFFLLENICKTTHRTTISRPWISGMKVPARQAAFKSHPCRPKAAPRSATPAVMMAFISAPKFSSPVCRPGMLLFLTAGVTLSVLVWLDAFVGTITISSVFSIESVITTSHFEYIKFLFYRNWQLARQPNCWLPDGRRKTVAVDAFLYQER